MMKEIAYKTLLVTTDGSDFAAEAFPHAVFLANQFNAKIIVLGVVESGGEEMFVPPPPNLNPAPSTIGPSAREIVNRNKKAVKDYLQKVKSQLEEGGANQVETKVAEGNPEGEIVSVAKRIKADLIVMATHGRSGFGRVLLGSVTEYVVRHASCPVFIIRPEQQ